MESVETTALPTPASNETVPPARVAGDCRMSTPPTFRNPLPGLSSVSGTARTSVLLPAVMIAPLAVPSRSPSVCVPAPTALWIVVVALEVVTASASVPPSDAMNDHRPRGSPGLTRPCHRESEISKGFIPALISTVRPLVSKRV